MPRVPRNFPDFPLRFIRASDREKKRISLILAGNGYPSFVRFINKGERLVQTASPSLLTVQQPTISAKQRMQDL